MVHPAPVVRLTDGLPLDASLVAWNTDEDRSVALGAVAYDGLYAVIPGKREVVYAEAQGRICALKTCAW